LWEWSNSRVNFEGKFVRIVNGFRLFFPAPTSKLSMVRVSRPEIDEAFLCATLGSRFTVPRARMNTPVSGGHRI
jgi:hypothetical protein